MPPWAAWWRGRDTIAGFAASAAEACADMRWTLTHANGQTAMAYYRLEEATGRWLPLALDVLTFEGDRISEITAFVTPDFFPRFGLPTELPPLRSST
jgi:RNA polymerase sigma-70 factor, ECF subfamily